MPKQANTHTHIMHANRRAQAGKHTHTPTQENPSYYFLFPQQFCWFQRICSSDVHCNWPTPTHIQDSSLYSLSNKYCPTTSNLKLLVDYAWVHGINTVTWRRRRRKKRKRAKTKENRLNRTSPDSLNNSRHTLYGGCLGREGRRHRRLGLWQRDSCVSRLESSAVIGSVSAHPHVVSESATTLYTGIKINHSPQPACLFIVSIPQLENPQVYPVPWQHGQLLPGPFTLKNR